jgi:hypothetical protein
MLLVGLFAAGMPVIHMRGAHYGEIAKSPGGFFFVWTLWGLGGIGGFTFILSARGLWGLRRASPGSPARGREMQGDSRPTDHLRLLPKFVGKSAVIPFEATEASLAITSRMK